MKKRELTPEQSAQLPGLHRRILLTLQFMNNVEDLDSFAQQLREVAQACLVKRDLRAMRLLAKQVEAGTIALSGPQREGLEAVLKNQLGVDKEAERAELRQRVAVLIARGRIDSEKQRRKLEEYLEMLDAIGDDPDEADAVRRLLSSQP